MFYTMSLGRPIVNSFTRNSFQLINVFAVVNNQVPYLLQVLSKLEMDQLVNFYERFIMDSYDAGTK